MRLRLRLLWLILASLWRAPLSVYDESVLTLRVLPNDIDLFKITDDRYFALMDLGRMDLAVRGGLSQGDAQAKVGARSHVYHHAISPPPEDVSAVPPANQDHILGRRRVLFQPGI